MTRIQRDRRYALARVTQNPVHSRFHLVLGEELLGIALARFPGKAAFTVKQKLCCFEEQFRRWLSCA